MNGQAVRSASSMWRHKNCTGNVLLQAALEEDGALAARNLLTKDSTIGQRIHSFLEGRAPDDITYNEGEIADMCAAIAKIADEAFFGTGIHANLTITVEERLNYVIDDTIFFSGKPDRVSKNDLGDILNVNYKTGRKESIEASENMQLRTEVVLIARAYDAYRIGASIVEPLVTKKPEIVVYDKAAIKKAESEILEIVDRTFWEKKRTAGPWCVHCPCRAHCPEARRYATDFPIIINVEALPRGEQGAEFLAKVRVAEKLLKAIQGAYRAILEEIPDAIPGWWISPGDQIRVVDPQTILGAMHENGMATVDFLACVTFHIGKLKELWRLHSSKDFDEVFAHTWSLKRKNGSLEPKRLK